MTRRSEGRGNLIALFLFFLVAIGWSSLPFFRPGLLSGETFLFHDNSYALFTADQLLAGKLLFRDVFYQYGAATAYVHAGWAALFGNTILSYWHLAQLLTCIGAIQLWILLRRSLSPWQALAFGTIVLFPSFLVPGGSVGGLGASVYVGLERICLLSIALIWRPPASRTFAAALGIGLLLGTMQLIKFGGAFVAGGSLVVIDLLALSYGGGEAKRWFHWLKISLATLLGFVAVEGSFCALLYLLLPAPLASEVLWPSWMVQNYAAYSHKSVAFLHWFNLNYFLGAQLPPVAAAMIGLAFIGRLLFKRGAIQQEERASVLFLAGPALFLLIFFALALMVYLPHMWVAMPYAWMILLPAAFFLREKTLALLWIFLLACVPAFLLSVKDLIHVPKTDALREVHLANDTLWLSAETENRVTQLRHVLERLRQERGDAGPADARHSWISDGLRVPSFSWVSSRHPSCLVHVGLCPAARGRKRF